VVGSVTMSIMKTRQNTLDERGEVNALLLSVIALAMLFLGALAFGVWAFNGRQDYKNNSDAKVVAAVAANKQAVQAADAQQYAEAAKNPVATYVGPDAYGSVHISYPKTWSAYIANGGAYPLDAYFHPDYVPSLQSGQTYNLRVRIVASAYSQDLNRYATYIAKGSIVATPYSLPKLPSVTGMELTGSIFPSAPTTQGAIVLLPLRDKTLEIWTESSDYLADFNKYVLPGTTFEP